MADELPKIQIDTDWKKQAQEEKRRLAEEAKAKAQAAAPATPAPSTSSGPAGRPGREAAAPSFGSLVQSITTQVLYHLGELAPRGAEPQLNLDMARYQIDILGVLDEKTKGNLSPDEQRLLDTALYEVRSRFVSVAAGVVNS